MSMNDFLSSLTPEQKKALLDALTSSQQSPQPKQNIEPEQEEPEDPKSNFIVNTKKPNNRRKEPVRARKNEWTDEGEDRHIETKYGARTPRTREPHKKVELECSVCGRPFKADPKYVYGEYYRCNKCTGK